MTSEAAVELSAPGLPYSFAKRHGVLLARQTGTLLLRAECVEIIHTAATPTTAFSETRRYLGKPLRLREVSEEEFQRLLSELYENTARDGGSMQMMEGLEEELDLFQVARQLSNEPEDLLESSDDAPIIRLINALLAEAIKENASDIHIEPYETRLVVRFRVDGVLREVLQPRRILAPLLVSRIKVMAKLDIAEKRLPQDGRISLRVAGRPVDVRVSTIPSGQGERVVMRLLDKQAGRLTLEHLGMAANELDRLEQLITRPHGIILVTGPTGSGKTTTLYAIVNRLNDRTRNIMTVEDPIEYYLDGINQTQVNTKVDMTFARGLRAILRQDPDVVMVGEIRDPETAHIAVQASLTGHLVLSTLHTNTAIGAITRLRDMGIEPFLLASSLLGVLSQRLTRVLCPTCKTPYTPSTEALRDLQLALPADAMPQLYQANGCPACAHLGYRGRTGIYELVALDEPLRNMIHSQASQHQMEAHAHGGVPAHGAMPSLRRDGLRRVLAGDTTLEELARVTHEQ